MSFRKGQVVRTVCCLESDDNNPALRVPPHTRAVIHELPQTNDGLYSVAIGLTVYDVEEGEIEPFPDGTPEAVSLHSTIESKAPAHAAIAPSANDLWRTGVQLWVEALNQSSDRKHITRMRSLDALESSLKLWSGEQSQLMCCRRLFLAVSLVDASRVTQALPYFASCLQPELPFTFTEYCCVLEKLGDIANARKLASSAPGIWSSAWQRPTFLYRSLKAQPFWEPSAFQWIPLLERRTPIILHELERLLQSRESIFQPVRGFPRHTGKHEEVVLFGASPQPLVAPNTCRLIEELVPEAVEMCRLGAAEVVLRRFGPHATIAPHCGSSNLHLTAHLGLVVPPADCGRCEIRLGEVEKGSKNQREGWRRWDEGRVMIFDESFEHEAVNNTDFPCILLLIRFWHPDLSDKLSKEKALAQWHAQTQEATARRWMPPLSTPSLDRWVHGTTGCPSCHTAATNDSIRFTTHQTGDDGICGTCTQCGFTTVPDEQVLPSSSVATSSSTAASSASTALLSASSTSPVVAVASGSSAASSSGSLSSSTTTTVSPVQLGANLPEEIQAKLRLAQQFIAESGYPIKLEIVLKEGDSVRLCGLGEANKHMNGVHGVLQRFNHSKNRWVVRLARDGNCVLVKPEHVQRQ